MIKVQFKSITKITLIFCASWLLSSCSETQNYRVEDVSFPSINSDLFKCGQSSGNLSKLRNETFGNIDDISPELLKIQAFQLNNRISGIFHIANIPNEYRDKVWNPHKNYISMIDNNFNDYISICPGWREEYMDAPRHSDKAYFGLIVDGRRYIYINGQYGSVGPENTGRSLKSPQSQYEEKFKSWRWYTFDGGHGIFTAVFDVELGAFVWIEYNGYA